MSSEMMGEAPEKFGEAVSLKTKKRPIGITIIAVLWFLGGILTLYTCSQEISAGIELLPYLSNLSTPKWFNFGIPTILAVNLLAFALGLIQIFAVYGLWTGKSWSYKLALSIPVLAVVIDISLVGLYMSAPVWLGLREYIDWVSVGSKIFWMIIYLSYFRGPHVKEYLEVSTARMEGRILRPKDKAEAKRDVGPSYPGLSYLCQGSTAQSRCPFCGMAVQDDDVFCSSCGRTIGGGK